MSARCMKVSPYRVGWTLSPPVMTRPAAISAYSSASGVLPSITGMPPAAAMAFIYVPLTERTGTPMGLKPILGICRGHQLVNAATGGANMLNFPRKHAVEHSEGIAHDVLAEPGSFLARIYGERFLVNSFHRDCAWSVGPGMREAAKSPDGLIEAIEHRDLPVFGVQFHPERMRGDNRVPALGPDGTKLFEFFVNIC